MTKTFTFQLDGYRVASGAICIEAETFEEAVAALKAMSSQPFNPLEDNELCGCMEDLGDRLHGVRAYGLEIDGEEAKDFVAVPLPTGEGDTLPCLDPPTLVAAGLDFGLTINAFAEHQAVTEPELAAYLEHAGDMSYVREGEVEVADPGFVSAGDDPGAYVLAWVWVDDETAGIEHEECPTCHGRGTLTPDGEDAQVCPTCEGLGEIVASDDAEETDHPAQPLVDELNALRAGRDRP